MRKLLTILGAGALGLCLWNCSDDNDMVSTWHPEEIPFIRGQELDQDPTDTCFSYLTHEHVCSLEINHPNFNLDANWFAVVTLKSTPLYMCDSVGADEDNDRPGDYYLVKGRLRVFNQNAFKYGSSPDVTYWTSGNYTYCGYYMKWFGVKCCIGTLDAATDTFVPLANDGVAVTFPGGYYPQPSTTQLSCKYSAGSTYKFCGTFMGVTTPTLTGKWSGSFEWNSDMSQTVPDMYINEVSHLNEPGWFFCMGNLPTDPTGSVPYYARYTIDINFSFIWHVPGTKNSTKDYYVRTTLEPYYQGLIKKKKKSTDTYDFPLGPFTYIDPLGTPCRLENQ